MKLFEQLGFAAKHEHERLELNHERLAQFRGKWVALARCEHDDRTGDTTCGDVVDSDIDLQSLVSRLGNEDQRNCEILFIDAVVQPAESTRSSRPPPRREE